MMPSLLRLFVRLLVTVALLAILVVAFLVRDGFARWPLSAYPISAASSHSWDEVFARPAPIVVETLVTGFIDMNRCDNLDQSNPAIARAAHWSRWRISSIWSAMLAWAAATGRE